MDALTEDGRPLLVAVVTTDLEDESRVTRPEVLIVSLSHQGDAMSLGETRRDRPRDMTAPVECHQLSGVKTNQLPGGGDSDSVVSP
jgi:hypothetical protein